MSPVAAVWAITSSQAGAVSISVTQGRTASPGVPGTEQGYTTN